MCYNAEKGESSAAAQPGGNRTVCGQPCKPYTALTAATYKGNYVYE
jgi:hypothetical protein